MGMVIKISWALRMKACLLHLMTGMERQGDGYVINGSKHWITGGGVSDLHLIFARLYENGFEQGIAGFIARRGDAGLVVGKREPAMGLRGIPETEIHFEDLYIKNRKNKKKENIKKGMKKKKKKKKDWNGTRLNSGDEFVTRISFFAVNEKKPALVHN
eukprot:TRINITY_DN106831_c0_g1_i1.p2 TRINITY_DN106831_c0_g1~~TRINITY_DN106831_c0_g1_i1.p2  ORF type:complete len:158 (-),score=23.71 TRINITY_DN106831_c0_g1_i1:5-478(-)